MGAHDSVVNLILNLIKQGTGAKDATNDLGDLDGQLRQVGNTILSDTIGFASLAGGTAAVINVVKESIGAWADAQSIYARMDATVQSTGRDSEISAPQIAALAKSMEGLFTHVDIEQAANELMRYMDIPTSAIPGDLVLIENMAAGLGETLPAAADTLGMALETGRVRGLGFSRELTNEISLMASHGDIANMDALIMDQLSQKFSGQYSAALDTYNGKVAILNTSWQNFLESLGSAFGGPAEAVLGFLTEMNNQMTAFPSEATNAVDEIKAIFSNNRLAADSIQDTSLAVDQLSQSTEGLAQATSGDASAVKDLTNQNDFMNAALKSIHTSDSDIQTIEDKIATARKEGYQDSGATIKGFQGQIDDLKAKEHTSMEQMTADWIYQNTVMGNKDPKVYQNFLDMEVKMGLISQAEEDDALGWVNYRDEMAIPVNATVTTTHLDVYEKEHLGEVQANHGSTGINTSGNKPLLPQASGGDYIVSKPTVFLAGEAGPERATFTPLSNGGAGGAGGGPVTIYLNVNGSGNPSAVAQEVIRLLGTLANLQGVRVKQ